MVSLLSSPALVPSLVAVFIGWRVYKRMRRLIGRQPVRTTRLVLTVIAFPLLLVLVGAASLRDVSLLEGIAAGAVVGIGLGLLALKLTRFEVTAAGCFFVPNTVIGIAVSVLFIGRLIFRFGVLYGATGGIDPSSLQSFGSSPLTLAIFGIVAAYYTTFALGVLLWYRQARERIPAVAPPVG